MARDPGLRGGSDQAPILTRIQQARPVHRVCCGEVADAALARDEQLADGACTGVDHACALAARQSRHLHSALAQGKTPTRKGRRLKSGKPEIHVKAETGAVAVALVTDWLPGGRYRAVVRSVIAGSGTAIEDGAPKELGVRFADERVR